ncbi:MAG: DUF4296 domain-containing protein [Flavobacteriales bacterium]|nr:DUF4296 domain-containing protein [Flavobacteriales bacterium]
MIRSAAFLLLALIACATPEAPADLLPRDRFKHLLLEAQLIEARVNHERIVEQRMDSPVEAYYDTLFSREGVTREQFDRTYTYYTQHPGELKAVLEEVLNELGQRKDSLR